MVDLPLVFEWSFRPRRYFVSHSELYPRSVDKVPAGDFVEITFCGVMGVRLESVYKPLVLARADREAADEMLRFAGVSEAKASWVRCLTLEPEGGGSFVVCGSFSVWSHPGGGFDQTGRSESGSMLLYRG